jgi:Ca2+-binding EF-hand superfamily protein
MKEVLLSLALLALPSLVIAEHHNREEGMYHDKEAVNEMFKKSDSNNDGKVSKDEFLKQAGEKFESYDEDNDGALSEKEHEAMAAHKHKKLMKNKE